MGFFLLPGDLRCQLARMLFDLAVNWNWFALALALWCLPGWIFLTRTQKDFYFDPYHQADRHIIRSAFCWQNAFDAARAAMAGLLWFFYVFPEEPLAFSRQNPEYWTFLWLTAGAIFLGVLPQTVVLRQGLFVVFPFFFILGITLILADIYAVLFALALAIAITRILANYELLGPVFAVTLMVFGYLLSSLNHFLYMAFVLNIFPLVTAFLLKKQLVLNRFRKRDVER